MNTGKILTSKEVSEIIRDSPFWNIESPAIVIKSYKDGRKKMFVIIKGVRYYIMKDKYGNDVWYKVKNGS